MLVMQDAWNTETIGSINFAPYLDYTNPCLLGGHHLSYYLCFSSQASIPIINDSTFLFSFLEKDRKQKMKNRRLATTIPIQNHCEGKKYQARMDIVKQSLTDY